MAVWIFARLTLQEAWRSRILVLAALLTACFIALLAWGSRTVQASVSLRGPVESLITAAGMELVAFFVGSFMIALLAVFVVGASTHHDAESGLLQSMLARPIRRADLLAGKWLGAAIISAAYIVLFAGAVAAAVGLTSGYVPSRLLPACALLLLEAIIMISLRVLFGSFLGSMPSGIVPLMLYGFAWMGGLVETLGQQLNVPGLVTTGIVSSLLMPTDVVWRGASYYLTPEEAAIAGGAVRGIPFVSTVPLAAPMLLWSILYAAAVFLAGAAIFSRRDI